MEVRDQVRAFAKQYKEKGDYLDLDLMKRLYPGIDVLASWNFLKSCTQFVPANMNGYDWRIKELARIYYTL